MTIKVGDRVAYSREFLRSIGAYTGELPFDRGKVVKLEAVLGRDIKPGEKPVFASVQWDDSGIPPEIVRIRISNLVLEDRIPFEER